MKRLLGVFGAALLLVAACASPSPTPSPSIASPSPTPSPSIAITCSDGGQPLGNVPGTCAELEQAALAAVADLGFPVKTIDISPFGWPCGVPFPGNEPRACPLARNGPTAYATFFGTDKVAALTFSHGTGGSVVATVIAFEVPPTGPAPA
jgi:hypothetical protein